RRIVSAIAGRKLPERRLAMLLLSVIAQCAYYRQSAPIIETLFPNLMTGPGVIDEIALHIAAFSIAGIHACGQMKS
ncbi:CerR family C-terminal domain-containing protein, partial [Halalkalibacter lacteus]|uniref:CerR family C-terminal domain-containing protein n=1 Tax=Halalkalibacter lacteus TaxID=3090663 RepID=UPI002FC9CF7D